MSTLWYSYCAIHIINFTSESNFIMYTYAYSINLQCIIECRNKIISINTWLRNGEH